MPSLTNAIAGWNPLDWLLVAIVLLSTIRALFRGAVQALFGMAGLICGLAAAAWEDAAVSAWVLRKGWLASPQIARVVCYAAILIGVTILFGIAGSLARKTAHAAGLGAVDRLLGGALGAARGTLIGIALIMMGKAVAPDAELLRQSRLSSCFLAAGHAVSFVVPRTFR